MCELDYLKKLIESTEGFLPLERYQTRRHHEVSNNVTYSKLLRPTISLVSAYILIIINEHFTVTTFFFSHTK